MSDNGIAHHKYGASSSERYIECPGNVALCAKLPKEPDNKYAINGTRGHECLQAYMECGGKYQATTRKLEANPVYDADHIDFALDAHTLIKSWAPPRAEILGERKVKLPVSYPDIFGTLDAAIVDWFGTLWIIDYKYGTARVYPNKGSEANSQLAFYALGLADELNYHFSSVKLAIIQPRGGAKSGRVWEMSMSDLLTWPDKFERAIDACEKPNAPLKVGSWCYWCPAKPSCPMHDKTERAQDAFAHLDFGDIEEDFLM